MAKKPLLKSVILMIVGILFLALTLTDSTYEIIFIIIGFVIILIGAFFLGRNIGKIRHKKNITK